MLDLHLGVHAGFIQGMDHGNIANTLVAPWLHTDLRRLAGSNIASRKNMSTQHIMQAACKLIGTAMCAYSQKVVMRSREWLPKHKESARTSSEHQDDHWRAYSPAKTILREKQCDLRPAELPKPAKQHYTLPLHTDTTRWSLHHLTAPSQAFLT